MTDQRIEIIDNFLPEEHFRTIKECFMGESYMRGRRFNWEWTDGISELKDGHFQLNRMIYCSSIPVSDYYSVLAPICDKEQFAATLRIKANLNVKTEKLKVFDNAFHEDMGELGIKYTTGIYYINTNDGYTLFETCGTKVESVANRFVKFPGNLRHTGTSCTDENRRVVINFNYIN